MINKNLGFFIFFLLGVILFPFRIFAQEEIDTLEFFLSKHEDKELITDDGGRHSQRTIGNSVFRIKWGDPQSHEYFTWDDQYIYLRYDNTWGEDSAHAGATSYEFAEVPGMGGRWMKRKMRVGEVINVDSANAQIWHTPDCAVHSRHHLKYTNTLEAHNPQYNAGGDLGIQDVIILRYQWGPTSYERFFFSKEWGWIRWEFYQDGQLKNVAVMNKISPCPPINPQPKCVNFPAPSPLPTPTPINLIAYQPKCDIPGKGKVTLSWGEVPNTIHYSLRIDDLSNGWQCENPYSGDYCLDVPSSNHSFVFNYIPGHRYNWWIHSFHLCRGWEEPANGSGFSCPVEDLNKDGKVDINDLKILIFHYLEDWIEGDLLSDRKINGLDLEKILSWIR